MIAVHYAGMVLVNGFLSGFLSGSEVLQPQYRSCYF